MEHTPWIGRDYHEQPADLRLLIVGFSHWGRFSDEKADDADFTRNVFERWIFDGGIRFFDSIAGYFGEVPGTFWHRVAFANTLPTTVGDEDERYSDGTPEQRAAVPDRVLRLIAELKPARIFVFSKKAWKLWPDYSGQLKDGTLRVEGVGEADCGTYAHDDGEAITFGLRHPQFASDVEMRAMVTAALKYQP